MVFANVLTRQYFTLWSFFPNTCVDKSSEVSGIVTNRRRHNADELQLPPFLIIFLCDNLEWMIDWSLEPIVDRVFYTSFTIDNMDRVRVSGDGRRIFGRIVYNCAMKNNQTSFWNRKWDSVSKIVINRLRGYEFGS